MKIDTKGVTREDYKNALKQFDTYINVSVDQLKSISEYAKISVYMREMGQVLTKDLITSPVISVRPNDTLMHRYISSPLINSVSSRLLMTLID